MIQMPRRSVTRFFIPLIDVLTLMFCIFLLMPVVQPMEDQLATNALSVMDLENQRREKARLTEELQQLREGKIAALQRRLTVCVLEIDGGTGKLFYFDAQRQTGRRVEVTRDNVHAIIEREKQAARGNDVYFLLLYPRPTSGVRVFPEKRQKDAYERWFNGVAHGYDSARHAR